MQQETSPCTTRGAARTPSGPARRGFLAAALAAGLVWIAVHLLLFRDLPVALWIPGLLILVSGLTLIGWLLPSGYPHDSFGACNTVTLIRGTLATTLVTPLLAGSPPGWAIFAIAAGTLALDGVDGWLARRSGLVSDFGARFDMETDAALALVLALHALVDGLAWPLVLILGGARYLFLGAMVAAPWLGRPLPERFSRKAICAFQLGVLVLLQAPPISGPPAVWLASAAATAVATSFGRDIVWLRRRRR